MKTPIEEDDDRVRAWLEPDRLTVERVVAGAFERARRGTALRPRLVAATALATLLCAVAAGTYLSREWRGHRPGSGPEPRSASTTPAATPAPVAGPGRVITAVSDGNVLVIHSSDGSSWVGNVERRGERPPAGSGTLIVDGGGQ